MAGLPLRIALELADLVVRALPASVAYPLADLVGRAWYRSSPARRALVTANLRRVSQATGRPTSDRALQALVRRAFVEHARYYLELLRAPHYPMTRIDRIVSVPQWDEFEAALRAGATVLVSAHVGNFEPFAAFLASKGWHAIAPIEEIEPRELYEFLARRRGSGRGVEVIPLSRSRRPMLNALRAGGVVGLVADRDLSGNGLPVELFGATTTMPIGPAWLAVTTGAAVIVGRCIRTGRDRFTVTGDRLAWEPGGERRREIEALTRRIASHMEADIAAAPAQWFGAFQPFWSEA